MQQFSEFMTEQTSDASAIYYHYREVCETFLLGNWPRESNETIDIAYIESLNWFLWPVSEWKVHALPKSLQLRTLYM